MIIYVQQVEQRREKMKNILKQTREEEGLSQEELAKRSKVSRTIISELETGKRNVG